jgi:serine/threonine protein kinase
MDHFKANNSIPLSHGKNPPLDLGSVEVASAEDASEQAFQLKRSQTILFRGDNDPSLTAQHSQWELKSDTSETNDAVPGGGSSDVSTGWEDGIRLSIEDLTEESDVSWPPCCLSAKKIDKLGQDTSHYLSSQHTEGSLGDGHDVSRLEVPNMATRLLRNESSFITDGGDQQFKSQRQARIVDDARNLEPNLSQRSTTAHDPAATFSPEPGELGYATDEFLLSSQIIDAMGQNRNPMQPRHERGFLPKAQMDLIVTPASVLRELCSCQLTAALTIEQVRKCAEDVCRETKICLDGKTYIRSFRKVFAILVLTEKPWAIFKFIEEGVSDLDLPLVVANNQDRRGMKELRRRDPLGNPSPERLQCSRGWPPTSVMNFERYQWTMLAPFFSPGKYDDVKHYVLRDQDILPFVSATQDKEDEIAELVGGGFGHVFMVHIHDEHHNFRHPQVRARGFAIKQLYESNREMFDKEVNILKRFSGTRAHPHIVSLLATYEQFQKFHLIFYKAEGDLFKYWKKINPRPTFDYENVLWIAKQCRGIANALLCLHKHYTLERCDTVCAQENEEEDDELEESPIKKEGTRFIIPRTHRKRDDRRPSSNIRHVRSASPTWPVGFPRISSDPQELPRQSTAEQPSLPLRHKRFKGDPYRQWGHHGDLKPENILFFSEPNTHNLKGMLKISDFGQAQFNSKSRKSKLQAGGVAHSLAYRAPESDLQPRKISQSHDIWSLGCVFLEFITWMLGGARLLRDFAVKRLSWDIFMKAKTDTFFEIVKNKETQEAEIMVKPAVAKVCRVTSLNSDP